MEETLEFLHNHGWVVLSWKQDLVEIHIDPIAVVRETARLRNTLADVGVQLYQLTVPISHPTAWAEYDACTMRAHIMLAVNDSWMPRGRKKVDAKATSGFVKHLAP